MKILLKYIIVCSVISGILASCALEEDTLLPDSGKSEVGTLVVAHIQDFTKHNVATKGTDSEERNIKNLAMLIFGSNGTEYELITSEPVYVDGEQLNFVINTSDKYIANIQSGTNEYKYYDGFTGDLSSTRLYIAANIKTLIEDAIENDKIEDDGEKHFTEEDFLNIGYTLLANIPKEGASMDNIEVPEGGFPMLGVLEGIDLSSNSSLDGGSESTLKVPVKKLFAKINVKFLVQLDTDNIPEGMDVVKTPYFEPNEWSVHNIPSNLTLRDSSAALKPVKTVFKTQNFTSFNFSTEKSKVNKRIENSTNGSEYFDFSFYMPEHKVLPVKDASSLPEEIETHLKQCHKPTFCNTDQTPTYVLIKGKYSNHQGHISEVEYRLYLGQDEIDDFQILRNQELNNTAVIKGLTNHSGGQNQISVDHRVDITSTGYSIAMERETLLDSHYEFRPMDISIQEGAVVVVKIPKVDSNGNPINTWFSAESKDAPFVTDNIDNVYDASVDKDGNRQYLRKYFTTNLISGLDKELAEMSHPYEFHLLGPADNNDAVVDQKTYRIWFYFDENTSAPYDADMASSETNKLYREGKIYVDFYDNTSAYIDGGEPKQKDREFTFRQMNLWSIKAPINDYNIEYFEEYLYNYAADDNYGVTTDGMEWGLENIELSSKTPAVYADKSKMGGWGEFFAGLFGGSNQDNFNDIFGTIDKKYDFYLTRDNMPKPRDYAGIEFTKEIVNQSSTNILDKSVTLSKTARSAVEYCYNKNKRNETGLVENIHWYLPSIDETEDILVAGFNYFTVFQSKYYWSSQPAYNKYSFTARQGNTSATGYFYEDDVKRARATIVTPDQTGALSGVTGTSGEYEITINNNIGTPNGPLGTSDQEPEIGNKERKARHRIRCAYSKSGYPHIFGNYTVALSTNAAGTNNKQTITVNISAYNTEINGEQYNVKLSNPLHPDYVNINYPQYAKFDKENQTLTIPMSQLMYDGSFMIFITWERYSILYNGSNVAADQNLVLKYNEDEASFELENIGDNIRYKDSANGTTANRGATSYYFQSFTRDTSL